MDAALGWFGSLFEWFGRWIPKILLIRATHGGVKFIRGKHIKEMKPDIHLYWPIMTDVEIIETARQTLNLHSQRLMTADNVPISVSAIVIYTIEDVIKALTQTVDYEATIADTAQTAVIEVLSKLTLQETIRGIDTLVTTSLTKKIRERLKKFGVNVETANLTDCARTFVITTITGD